jgi:hypothetical protein
MPTLPIPVDRLLVPADPPAPPDSFARVRQALERGLPASVRLDDELSLALYVPTGDALLWRDADGDAPVAAAADDAAPRAAAVGDDPVAEAPARLVLRRAGQKVAVVPLVAGLRRRLPDDGGARGALVEIWIRDFQLNAGTLRQTGDFGSFVDLAWRRVDRGADRFALPPLDPRVAERFAGAIESQVGVADGGEGQQA